MDQPGVVWIAAGLVLMASELLLPGAFLLWLGLAGVGTGLVGRVVSLGFAWEVVVFAALTTLSIGGALLLRRRTRPSGVNAPGSGLIGRSVTSLGFDGLEGRVRLGDSDWPARLASGELPAHRALTVVGVDGMVLLVRAAEVTQP